MTSDEPSPFERELQTRLELARWDLSDHETVALAIHRVTCPDDPCHHVINDVDELDQRRAATALAALRERLRDTP